MKKLLLILLFPITLFAATNKVVNTVEIRDANSPISSSAAGNFSSVKSGNVTYTGTTGNTNNVLISYGNGNTAFIDATTLGIFGNAFTNTVGFQNWVTTQTNRFLGGVFIGTDTIATNGQVFAVRGSGVSGTQVATFGTTSGTNSVVRFGNSTNSWTISVPGDGGVGSNSDVTLQNMASQASVRFLDSAGTAHITISKSSTSPETYGPGGAGSTVLINGRTTQLGDASTSTIALNGRSMTLNPFINIASGALFITNTTAFVGLSTTTPTSTLDVNGIATVRSNLNLNAPGGKIIVMTNAVQTAGANVAGFAVFDGGATAKSIVSNSLVTANTIILANERNAPSGVAGSVIIESQSAGTFTARSTTALDTNQFSYILYEPF